MEPVGTPESFLVVNVGASAMLVSKKYDWFAAATCPSKIMSDTDVLASKAQLHRHYHP